METAQEYRERLWKELATRDPLDVLRRTPEVLKGWLENHSAHWNQSNSGRWSAGQILAHFAEGEIVFGYRIRMIVRDSGNSIQAYDQNVWVNNSDYLVQNPSLALEMFWALRKVNIALIESLPPDVMNCYGVHSERGKETLQDLIRMTAGHDLNHLKQVEKIVH